MEVEVGTMEEEDGTMEEVTITTSLAPVPLTAAGGREVLRRLPGPPTVEVVIMEMEDGVEDLADTKAITTVLEMEVRATTTEVTEEGDVSETASVPALSSAATCTVATSAPSLSTTADQTYKQSYKKTYNLVV